MSEQLKQTGINLYEGMGGVGLHVDYDTIDDKGTAELRDLMFILNPATTQIIGAAKKPQAFGFATWYKAQRPRTRITFRNFEDHTGDDGNWKKHPYEGNPKRWFEVHKPFMDAGLSVLTDNESAEGNFGGYIDWSLGCMEEVSKFDGYQADFARQAVGWPGDGTGGSTYQYDQFDRLYAAQAEFTDGRFSLSPNEYFPWNDPYNKNYVGRFEKHFQRASDKGYFIYNLFIGEFATVYQHPSGYLDAGKGWSSPELALDVVTYLERAIQVWELRYKPYGIPVNFFSWGDDGDFQKGKWRYFRLDNNPTAKKWLIDQAEKGRFILPKVSIGTVTPPKPPVIQPPQPPEYELPTAAIPYVVEFPITSGRRYINVRQSPPSGAVLKTISPGQRVFVIGMKEASDGSIWVRVLLDNTNVVGWVYTQKGAIGFRGV